MRILNIIAYLIIPAAIINNNSYTMDNNKNEIKEEEYKNNIHSSNLLSKIIKLLSEIMENDLDMDNLDIYDPETLEIYGKVDENKKNVRYTMLKEIHSHIIMTLGHFLNQISDKIQSNDPIDGEKEIQNICNALNNIYANNKYRETIINCTNKNLSQNLYKDITNKYQNLTNIEFCDLQTLLFFIEKSEFLTKEMKQLLNNYQKSESEQITSPGHNINKIINLVSEEYKSYFRTCNILLSCNLNISGKSLSNIIDKMYCDVVRHNDGILCDQNKLKEAILSYCKNKKIPLQVPDNYYDSRDLWNSLSYLLECKHNIDIEFDKFWANVKQFLISCINYNGKINDSLYKRFAYGNNLIENEKNDKINLSLSNNEYNELIEYIKYINLFKCYNSDCQYIHNVIQNKIRENNTLETDIEKFFKNAYICKINGKEKNIILYKDMQNFNDVCMVDSTSEGDPIYIFNNCDNLEDNSQIKSFVKKNLLKYGVIKYQPDNQYLYKYKYQLVAYDDQNNLYYFDKNQQPNKMVIDQLVDIKEKDNKLKELKKLKIELINKSKNAMNSLVKQYHQNKILLGEAHTKEPNESEKSQMSNKLQSIIFSTDLQGIINDTLKINEYFIREKVGFLCNQNNLYIVFDIICYNNEIIDLNKQIKFLEQEY